MAHIERRPIRYDTNTWIVMRNDEVLPKAIIRRVLFKDGHEKFFVHRWDLDPLKQPVMGFADTLEDANDRVLFDSPHPKQPLDGKHPGPSH